MLGSSSVDPSASWVSSSQSSVSLRHSSEAVNSISSDHSSAPTPQQRTISSLPNVTIKGEPFCEEDEPSTSHAHEVERQPSTSRDPAEVASTSGQLSSEEPMTSSTSLPKRRIRVTFRLPPRQALRLKRIANVQPNRLRRMGWSTFQVGREGEAVNVNDLIPVPVVHQPPVAPIRYDEQRRPDSSLDRLADNRANGPVPVPTGGVNTAPTPQPQPPGVVHDGSTAAHPVQNRPSTNNNSPMLMNLLSSQQQQQQAGAPPVAAGPSLNQQQPMGQRAFSPYGYPPQTPHPHAGGPVPGMDPQQQQHMAAMQQQQIHERHRMMMHQQQQHALQMQQQQAMAAAHAHAQATANGSAGPSGQSCTTPGAGQPPLTPGGYYQTGNPPAGPSQPHQQRPGPSMGYTQGAPMAPGPMYPGQPPQRLSGPPYPGPGPAGQVPPQAMPMQPTHIRPPAEEAAQPPKKKRKPTKKQQKEAELAAAAQAQQNAQQPQFMPDRMMHQPHMNSGVPMMGYPQGYPQGPGVAQFAQYPPGASQQQQMWQQQQMQQRMMYQQHQHQHPHASGQPWPPQRAAVPYPPTPGIEGPGSVHPPASQRTSAEFSQDGTSPAASTPQHQNPMSHQMANTPSQPYMRTDSQGNLFNFAHSQSHTPSASDNPVDKLWNSQDFHMGDLGDLDDIEPMGELSGSGSLLADAGILDGPSDSTSLSTTDQKPNPPSTPNGDHIDSCIASVVEMVSKSNTQIPSQSSPIVSQAQATSISSGGPLKRRPSNAQMAASIVASAEQQHAHNEHMRSQNQMQMPQMGAPPMSSAQQQQHIGGTFGVAAPISRVKLENGGSRPNNGHDQLPNGSRRLTPTAPAEDTSDAQIGQLVTKLLAEEQRKKAADAESKAKQPRKGRRKADVSKEGSPRDEDELGMLDGGIGAARVRHPSAAGTAIQTASTNFHQSLARQQQLQQQIKHQQQQQLQPKQ